MKCATEQKKIISRKPLHIVLSDYNNFFINGGENFTLQNHEWNLTGDTPIGRYSKFFIVSFPFHVWYGREKKNISPFFIFSCSFAYFSRCYSLYGWEQLKNQKYLLLCPVAFFPSLCFSEFYVNAQLIDISVYELHTMEQHTSDVFDDDGPRFSRFFFYSPHQIRFNEWTQRNKFTVEANSFVKELPTLYLNIKQKNEIEIEIL